MIDNFAGFVYYWDDHITACEPRTGDTDAGTLARANLNDIFELLKTSRALKSYFRSRELIRSSNQIKFDHLWTLFGPGTRVVIRSYINEIQMFEVDCRYPLSTNDSGLKVPCVAFDWNGTDFVAYAYDFYIKKYSGDALIDSLELDSVVYYRREDGVTRCHELSSKLQQGGQR